MEDVQFRFDCILTPDGRIRPNKMFVHLEERVNKERWDADINNTIFQ